MGTHIEYGNLNRDMGQSIWLIQGDGRNQWYTALGWQKQKLDTFDTGSEGISYTFKYSAYTYCIHTIQVPDPSDQKTEVVFRNVTTGQVRLVERCDLSCPVYMHTGSKKSAVTLLEETPYAASKYGEVTVVVNGEAYE